MYKVYIVRDVQISASTFPWVQSRLTCWCACIQDNQKAIAEEEKKKDEELDRQALLAEQRREEERLLQEEQQREKMEKIKAVEGKMDDYGEGWNTNGKLYKFCLCVPIPSHIPAVL